MEIDAWIDGYKVRSFPWIDGKRIYVNVQYYKPGSSLSQPPAFDKSAFIVDDEVGRRFVNEFTHTMVNYISRLNIPQGTEITITVQPNQTAIC